MLTFVLFSPPQQQVLGLTALLRSRSLRDRVASITVRLTDWTAAAAIEAICRGGGGGGEVESVSTSSIRMVLSSSE